MEILIFQHRLFNTFSVSGVSVLVLMGVSVGVSMSMSVGVSMGVSVGVALWQQV